MMRIALGPCLSLVLAGCGSIPLPQHQASVEAIQSLRSGDLASLQVGTFIKDAKLPVKADQLVASRSVTITSPDGGSFALYLGNVLKTDLEAAGKLDPQSGAVVQGVLTKNELSTGIGTGTATLGARFTLTRNGAAVYDKDLVAQQLWDGNFIGAIAIPDAINHYQSLYKNLVEKLLADEEFRKAAAR
jgi:hypothetical protein